jgi:hypothetical protein
MNQRTRVLNENKAVIKLYNSTVKLTIVLLLVQKITVSPLVLYREHSILTSPVDTDAQKRLSSSIRTVMANE